MRSQGPSRDTSNLVGSFAALAVAWLICLGISWFRFRDPAAPWVGLAFVLPFLMPWWLCLWHPPLRRLVRWDGTPRPGHRPDRTRRAERRVRLAAIVGLACVAVGLVSMYRAGSYGWRTEIGSVQPAIPWFIAAVGWSVTLARPGLVMRLLRGEILAPAAAPASPGRRLECHRCGYDVTACTGGVCSECGTRIVRTVYPRRAVVLDALHGAFVTVAVVGLTLGFLKMADQWIWPHEVSAIEIAFDWRPIAALGALLGLGLVAGLLTSSRAPAITACVLGALCVLGAQTWGDELHAARAAVRVGMSSEEVQAIVAPLHARPGIEVKEYHSPLEGPLRLTHAWIIHCYRASTDSQLEIGIDGGVCTQVELMHFD